MFIDVESLSCPTSKEISRRGGTTATSGIGGMFGNRCSDTHGVKWKGMLRVAAGRGWN